MNQGCHVEVRIEAADFAVGDEMHALYERTDGSLGAVACFTGLVRDRFGNDSVTALHLEHYPGMTERSIEKIIAQARHRWPLLDVLVIHRIGEIAAREQIVYVQVGSGHRDAAFAAAEFIMDYLKTDAVLWKREAHAVAAGGTVKSRWVEATVADRTRRAEWDQSSTDPNR